MAPAPVETELRVAFPKVMIVIDGQDVAPTSPTVREYNDQAAPGMSKWRNYGDLSLVGENHPDLLVKFNRQPRYTSGSDFDVDKYHVLVSPDQLNKLTAADREAKVHDVQRIVNNLVQATQNKKLRALEEKIKTGAVQHISLESPLPKRRWSPPPPPTSDDEKKGSPDARTPYASGLSKVKLNLFKSAKKTTDQKANPATRYEKEPAEAPGLGPYTTSEEKRKRKRRPKVSSEASPDLDTTTVAAAPKKKRVKITRRRAATAGGSPNEPSDFAASPKEREKILERLADVLDERQIACNECGNGGKLKFALTGRYVIRTSQSGKKIPKIVCTNRPHRPTGSTADGQKEWPAGCWSEMNVKEAKLQLLEED